jgi:phospholipase C
MSLNRREFVSRMAGACGATLFGSLAGLNSEALFASEETSVAALPQPAESGIDHIVVVTMENRSYDHFLGWLPGGNGKQAGMSYVDAKGASHSTHRLAPDYTGCPHPSPDHSYQGSRIDYDHGRMDGFLKNTANDVYAIGYYTETDIPFYGALARNYTTLSNYYCSILGPTFPNRIFQLAAQTDRLDDSVSFSSLPTIFDALSSAGIRARYYYSNVPFLALWGLKYLGISSSYDDFLADAASGNLPAVSYVDPRYTILDDGTGNDDHPHADIRAGEAFLARTFHAVASGPAWKKTVLIVNFDENGGFFEHIAPPRAAAPNQVDPDLVNGKALLGPRVPTVIASPFTRGTPATPRVDNTVFDHTSVLKLIEWRWNLPPLTARDGSSDVGNLAVALNFASPDDAVPALPTPIAPLPLPCFSGLLGAVTGAVEKPATTAFGKLANSQLTKGWKIRQKAVLRPE